ncbi:hypothetical protein CL654_02705 [bacterium]|nr:hypothetical protein [bacterium]|tara:strand:+ start:22161 stop:23453 length:1293 start_codon:yes stop_codon:yes gene_type:complete
MKNIFKSIVVSVLRYEARLVLLKYKPKTIGVTGSVGKTTTKDAIHAVMEEHFFAYKSKKSYNSELGLPLTVLMEESGWGNPILWAKTIVKGLLLIFLKNHYPKWLVLEMGIDRPGDMKKATQLVKPDISVFTKFPDVPVHVEFFSSPEAVHKEKWILAKQTKKNGTIIINGDDPVLVEKAEEMKDTHHVITFGLKEGNDVRAENIHEHIEAGKEGIAFKVDYKGNNVPIKLKGVLGVGYVYSALAGIAVGVSQDLNLVQISQALESFKPPPGRLRVLGGVNKSIVIDDTYNSSPPAAELALNVLVNTVGTRKIVVLGDMLELGTFTVPEHRALGKKVKEAGIDILYTVGPRAQSIARGANEAGMRKKDIREFFDSRKAGESLSKILKEGDVVMVKGSQGIRLEKAVKIILGNPERDTKHLVRQEKEWGKR